MRAGAGRQKKKMVVCPGKTCLVRRKIGLTSEWATE